jgi:hypothetical protein
MTGHMGPIAHAAGVNRHLIDHITKAAVLDGQSGMIAA